MYTYMIYHNIGYMCVYNVTRGGDPFACASVYPDVHIDTCINTHIYNIFNISYCIHNVYNIYIYIIIYTICVYYICIYNIS